MRHLVRAVLICMFAGGIILGTSSLAFYDLLKDFDWCPEHRGQASLLGAAIGGGLGCIVGIFVGWQRLRRYQDLKLLAASEAGEFIDKADDRLVERVKNLLGKLGNVSLRSIMKLVTRDRRTSLWIGDLYVRDVGTESRRVERRTIAAFQHSDLSLPQFILQRRRFLLSLFASLAGLKDIRFVDCPGLSESYHLSGSSEQLVTRLFDKSLLDHFSRQAGCEVGGDGDWLVIAAPQRKHLSASSRKLFKSQAQQIFAMFVVACRDLDTTVEPAETAADFSPGGPLDKLTSTMTPDSDITQFLSQPVPRFVPPQISRPHMIPAIMMAIFGAFTLFATGISVIALFVAPLTVAVPLGAISLTLGSLLLGAAWRFRHRKLRLLSHGEVTLGSIQSVTKAAVRSSTTRYRVQVRYEAMSSPTVGNIVLPGDLVEKAWKAQEQDLQVPLIFDPDDPQHFLLAWQLSSTATLLAKFGRARLDPNS